MRDANESALNQYLKEQEKQDKHDEQIERRTNEIFNGYMAALVLDSSHTKAIHPWPAWNCWSAVNDIKREHWLPIARALIAQDYEVLGRLIALGVAETLKEQAESEAEEELDEGM